MRFIEKLQLIERINQLIKMKATGSARDLARRVRVSKSTVYEIIEVMKRMGAEIEYYNVRRSYFYYSDKELAIGFVDPRTLASNTMKIEEDKVSQTIRLDIPPSS